VKYLTAKDIAEELGVSRSLAYEIVRECARVVAGRTIRVSRAAFDGRHMPTLRQRGTTRATRTHHLKTRRNTMTVAAFVLAASAILVPNRDHAALDAAITARVDAELPLFKDDADKRKTAALLVSISFRESSLRNDAIGDKGQSSCAFQIYLPSAQKTREGWSGPELRDDPIKCVTVAMRLLRESFRVDARNPVAFYARGPRWQAPEARRISADRMALARRLLAQVSH